jgi:hypothetical protein
MRKPAIRMMVVAAAIVAACVAVPTAQTAEGRVDVTGIWAFEVQTENGTGTPTVTFKQDGEKLTGHYSSQFLGEADLTGTVKGQAIEFVVAANVQGNAIELSFAGIVENKDSMKGKVSLAGMGEGTFAGKRKSNSMP